MRLSIGLGLSTLRGTAAIITATAPPTMGALSDSDTPADGYVAGSYTSTEGTISSAVPTYYVNGAVQPGTYDLQAGDAVFAQVLVTDSVGNTRTYTTNTSTVPGGAVGAFSSAFSSAFAV
jgi:hypothetical protein